MDRIIANRQQNMSGNVHARLCINAFEVWNSLLWYYEDNYFNIAVQISTRRGGGRDYLTDYLTHWGRVTHICVSKLTIIGSDNGCNGFNVILLRFTVICAPDNAFKLRLCKASECPGDIPCVWRKHGKIFFDYIFIACWGMTITNGGFNQCLVNEDIIHLIQIG